MLLHEGIESKVEKPLNPAQKAALVLSGLTTIALCYAFSIVAVALLLVLLAGDLVLWLAAARFGMAGYASDVVKRHAGLLSIFLRSFWLRKGKEYRLLLVERDAPRLFASITRLAQHFEIEPPREISIEMSANAWVRLKGYRRGATGTVLAIGYDLLAGLSETEVQAVLAHEMGHAKFVRRGLKRWFDLGVVRISTITNRLSIQAESYRSSDKKFHLAELFLRFADELTRSAARLLATYSRQDEFEADRTSAQLIGSASVRSSLIKLELLNIKLNRVPWTERVAQLEAEAGFSHWLVNELKIERHKIDSEIPECVHDPYSTHPSLRDRIAALPVDDGRRPNTAPGIELLADPDQVAADLIAEVHRVAALVEQEDSTAVTRWIDKDRKVGTRGRFWVGFAVIVIGFVLAIGFLDVDEYNNAGLCVLVVGVGGLILMFWRHRDRVHIPIPRYSDMKKAWQADRPPDFAEQEHQIEAELTQLINAHSKKRQKLSALTREGARALEQCEYLRASVAGRFAIGLNDKNVDGVLVYLIASAGLGLWDNFDQNYAFIRQRTALATPATNWGTAWALFLAGDWTRAEALLLKARRKQAENTTILAMLAVTQAQRNKYQSAVLHAVKAADIEPNDLELSKLATRLLLDSGRLGEAAARLCTVESHADSDPEVAMMVVRLHLLRREYEEAREAVDVVRRADSDPQRLIQLGGVFETFRQDEYAARLYREALNAGHYPEALLSLARLATNEERFIEAREHLTCALNLEKETAPKGRTAVDLFQPLVSQLSFLAEPLADCKAWILTFPADATPAALADRSLMFFGHTRYSAETHLDFILKAMQPTGTPISASKLQWREAPADKQPARPVREGIQAVL